MRELVVVAIAAPVVVGIYEDGTLARTLTSPKHASEALIDLLGEALAEGEIAAVTYANGPGSFMGLKVAYTTLKVFCDARGVQLWAASGFEFCERIKSNGAMCFVRRGGSVGAGANSGGGADGMGAVSGGSADGAGEIILEVATPTQVRLPRRLSEISRSKDVLPNYVLDAV